MHLARALELEPQLAGGANLAGVFFEMQEDYERARKLYGKAIKYEPNYEPAQQNMRRIFELFNFGSSKEPSPSAIELSIVHARLSAPSSNTLNIT